jgi:hypothetical protein
MLVVTDERRIDGGFDLERASSSRIDSAGRGDDRGCGLERDRTGFRSGGGGDRRAELR